MKKATSKNFEQKVIFIANVNILVSILRHTKVLGTKYLRVILPGMAHMGGLQCIN